MADRTPKEVAAAHGLVMLSERAINSTNTHAQHQHAQSPEAYTEEEPAGIGQHYQVVGDREHGVSPVGQAAAAGHGTADDQLQQFANAKPPTPAAASPPKATPVPQLRTSPNTTQSRIPCFVRLNGTLVQRFCPHIAGERQLACLEQRCSHHCCQPSHEIWQELRRGPPQAMPALQPTPQATQPPSQRRRAPGRARRDQVTQRLRRAAPGNGQFDEAVTDAYDVPAPAQSNQLMGGLPMAQPPLLVAPLGLQSDRSSAMVIPSQFMPRLQPQPQLPAQRGYYGQPHFAPNYQYFSNPLQCYQLPMQPPLQTPTYGLIHFNDYPDGRGMQQLMRPMIPHQRVRSFHRSPTPHAQRQPAGYVDLTEEEDDDDVVVTEVRPRPQPIATMVPTPRADAPLAQAVEEKRMEDKKSKEDGVEAAKAKVEGVEEGKAEVGEMEELKAYHQHANKREDADVDMGSDHGAGDDTA